MKLIGKPVSQTLLDIFQSLNPESIDEILLATAYMNETGFNFIRGLIEKIKTKIIVCLDPRVTDWEPLEDIIKIKSVECRYYNPKRNGEYFHPKMYIIKHKTGEYSVIIGSSNLTQGGIRDNIEANLYLERLSYKEAKDFLDYFNHLFENAKPLDRSAVNDFRKRRDSYIIKEREWQIQAMRNRTARNFVPSQHVYLISDQVKKVKRILKKERNRYVEWFKGENREKKDHCEDRQNHVNLIKEYALREDWSNLFYHVWSVDCLFFFLAGRFPKLAEACGKDIFRKQNKHKLAECLAKVNAGLLRDWIIEIEKGDWENANEILQKLYGIGDKIQSELFCVYHGDEFGIKNDKSIKALKYLLGDSDSNFHYKSYNSMNYFMFNDILKEIGRIYSEVIGRLCVQVPLLMELDAFFWYLYEHSGGLEGYG